MATGLATLSAWESVPPGAFTCSELRSWLSGSDREIPVFTGVNGTLIARRSRTAPYLMPLRPSAFQAGHIPRCCMTCERPWLPLTGDVCVGCCCCCHLRPALCRGWPASGPGRLRPGPWFLTGVSAEVSRIKRDFACTFTRHFPCTRCPAVTVTLDAGGADTYTQRPSPDLSPAKTLAPSARMPPVRQPNLISDRVTRYLPPYQLPLGAMLGVGQ